MQMVSIFKIITVGTKSNSTYMGVGDNILNITPYLITSTPGLQGFASVSVTTAECAPVGEVIQGTINGGKEKE